MSDYADPILALLAELYAKLTLATERIAKLEDDARQGDDDSPAGTDG